MILNIMNNKKPIYILSILLLLSIGYWMYPTWEYSKEKIENIYNTKSKETKQSLVDEWIKEGIITLPINTVYLPDTTEKKINPLDYIIKSPLFENLINKKDTIENESQN